jgi:putrescine aminotransferase
MQQLGGSRIITRAQGCTIYDGDGNALLDAMAGLWCVQVGYGREELAKAAYDQMLELPYYNTFFKTVAPPTCCWRQGRRADGRQSAARVLQQLRLRGDRHVIRLARYYWQAKGEPNRNVIISRVNGYHGSTIAGASLGGMKHMHVQGGPWMPGIEHVMQPYRFNEGFGEDPEAFGERAAAGGRDRILEVGPRTSRPSSASRCRARAA